jgi:hypothetical protein
MTMAMMKLDCFVKANWGSSTGVDWLDYTGEGVTCYCAEVAMLASSIMGIAEASDGTVCTNLIPFNVCRQFG